MITETKTPAERREAEVVEQVQKLRKEREQLLTRQRSATGEVERLNGEIAVAAQARDEKALAALRKELQGQQGAIEDLGRILTTIEQEFELAQAEHRAATIACHADRYNRLVERQCFLAGTIENAIKTIVQAVASKEELATKQKLIQGSCNLITVYPMLSPSDPRPIVLRKITERLEQRVSSHKPLPALDWTCRQMSEHGDLLLRSE